MLTGAHCPGCGWDEASILDDSAVWKGLDRAGMMGFTAAFHVQCEEAVRLGREWAATLPGAKVEHTVVAGMGGSGAGGDLLQALAEKPVTVSKGYEIPPFVGVGTLFFAVSHSGKTEETISAYRAGRERGALVLAIASGGELADLAGRDGVPFCLIPGGQPPRTAFGFLSLPLLLAAARYEVTALPDSGTQETLGVLEEVAEACGPMNATPGNPAKQLALALKGSIPIVYGAQGLTGAVALRWKTQFNENAKLPSFSYCLPEMNHNEIMGWEGVKEQDKTFAVVMLREGTESPRIRARFDITKSLIKDKAPFYEVWGRGEAPLARAMYLNHFGDWVTVYSALLRGVDPSAIDSINRLKTALSRM